MTLLVQITDTHILQPGELLYGQTDTAAHLKTVRQINDMRPRPDAVLITGDLIDNPAEACYQHFMALVKPLEMPVFVIPGNHDSPTVMQKVFAGTPWFPATDDTFQYAIEGLPFRVLALNSHADDTELPEFGERGLAWLREQLNRSDKPVLIAIHHPPMVTGIEFIDMGGTDWLQGLKSVLEDHDHVKLLICGHCHTDLTGKIAGVPVYMAPATAHLLIAAGGIDIAPSTVITAGAPILHQFINGDFLSGSYAWPADVEAGRLDNKSGLSWDELKKSMMGSKT